MRRGHRRNTALCAYVEQRIVENPMGRYPAEVHLGNELR